MRFPTRFLASNLWFSLMLWLAFVVVVTVITVLIGVFGTLDQSVWEGAIQVTRWYAVFAGIALVTQFLPLYIAHGQTRRQFGAQAAVTGALYAVFLAALLVVGLLLEKALYAVGGWPQTFVKTHLYTDPIQVHLVLLEYLVEFLALLAAGLLIGAAFYRWRAAGLLAIPVGLALIVVSLGATGAEFQLPLSSFSLGVDLRSSLLMTLGVGVGTFVVGLALTWPIIRNVPLRNPA